LTKFLDEYDLDSSVIEEVKKLIRAQKFIVKEAEKISKEIKDPLARQVFLDCVCYGLSAGILTAVIKIKKGAKKK